MPNINTYHSLHQNRMEAIGSVATAIHSASVELRQGCTVIADVTNATTVYVGGSGVTSTAGVPLGSGDSMFIPIDNINKVYGISAAGHSGTLYWMGV